MELSFETVGHAMNAGAKPDASVSRSPWWYRQRALVMGIIYSVSFYASYDLAARFHRSSVPIFMLFGEGTARLVLAAATLLALAAWLVRAWGTSYLRAEIVWNHDTKTDRLCIAGPFRYTRNPLYLGNLFLAAAFGLFAPPIGWWIIVFAQWAFIAALIGEEERGLRARYGEEFDRYCAQVPKLLPRVTPVAGTALAHGTLVRAMLAESMTGGFTLALAVYAIFGMGAWPYAWGIALAGLTMQSFMRSKS
jgi:protein-S-isoprenylcysteine O-methyltransferase Ste14